MSRRAISILAMAAWVLVLVSSGQAFFQHRRSCVWCVCRSAPGVAAIGVYCRAAAGVPGRCRQAWVRRCAGGGGIGFVNLLRSGMMPDPKSVKAENVCQRCGGIIDAGSAVAVIGCFRLFSYYLRKSKLLRRQTDAGAHNTSSLLGWRGTHERICQQL